MNKTEAVAANTVLRWMIGDGAINAATAYRQAEILAGRVTTTLGAGVRPGQVREAFTRQPHPERGNLPDAVLDLLAGCWQIETNDGGWNGGDVVEELCGWFERLGINITHPGRRSDRDDDLDDWSESDVEEFARLHGCDDTAPPAPDAPVLVPTPEGGHATIEAGAVRALVGHVAERDTTDLAVSLHPVHNAPVREGAGGGARDV